MFFFSCTWWLWWLLLYFPYSENIYKTFRWPDPGLCLSWEADCLGRCYSIFLNGKALLMFLFFCCSDTADSSSLRIVSVIAADLAISILHNHLVPLWATNNLLSSCQAWLNHSHLFAPVSSSLLVYQHHFLMGNSLQTEKNLRWKQWENPFHYTKWGNRISAGLGFFKCMKNITVFSFVP